MKFSIVSFALFALASVEARVGRNLTGRNHLYTLYFKNPCDDDVEVQVDIRNDGDQPYQNIAANSCAVFNGGEQYRGPDIRYDVVGTYGLPIKIDCNYSDNNACNWDGMARNACVISIDNCPTNYTPSPTPSPSPPKDVCYDDEKCKACPVYMQGGVNWQDPNNCPYCAPTAPECPPSPTPSPTPSPPKDFCYDDEKCKACPVYMQGGVNWQDPNNCPYCDPKAPECPPQYDMCTKDITWCSTGGNMAASTQCAPCCNQEFDSSNERKDCQHACKDAYLNTCSGEWDDNWERTLQRTGEQIPDPNFLN